MRRKFSFLQKIIGLVLGLFLCLCAQAQQPPVDTSVDELFSNALKSYQAGSFKESKTLLEQAISQQPNNVSLLYNLGLAEYRLGENGPAIARWRKALSIDPSFSDVSDAIDAVFSKLEKKELPHQVSLFEKIRGSLLSSISLNQTLTLLALSLFAALWLLIGHLGRGRQARENESPPPAPSFKLVLAQVLALCALTLAGLKVYDYSQPRGTVLVKSVDVRTGPDESNASIFEISEGLEVLIEEAQNDWFKVTYPGGRSGWIQRNAVLQTWGRNF